MQDIRSLLTSNELIVFDGGLGTMLQGRGMRPGESPELFGARAPEAVVAVHEEYVRAGAMVVTTNTFGGSGFKLPEGTDVAGLNREMARAARVAAKDRALVAGSVGPTGRMIEPLGSMLFDEAVAAFEEQIRGLAAGGVDLILAETQYDLAEARAVLVAARRACDLPVGVSMTFEQGASLTGTPPETFADTVANMGVDLVAVNCSSGPEDMLAVVRAMVGRTEIPILAQPNAGLPVLENGETVFRMGPNSFAKRMLPFVEAGAKALGGCCGTTPEHIRALAKVLAGSTWRRPRTDLAPGIVLTSRFTSVACRIGRPMRIIGERINPTGKKALTAELQEGKLRAALDLAREQEETGAHILDVNVGAPMVDEKDCLPRLVKALVSRVRTPLCLDSSDAEAVALGLSAYPGSALVNSISGEKGRMERLGPLCRDMGAPFILLPLRGGKLPVTAAERLTIVEELLAEAEALGIPRRLIMVDALALTVSSKAEAALACLEVIRHCRKRWGLPTVLGLSNISFGLPARELVNSAFLALAMEAGLAACIANPNSSRLMETAAAVEVLLNRDPQATTFIGGYADWRPTGGGARIVSKREGASMEGFTPLQAMVVRGEKDSLTAAISERIETGDSPLAIVNDELIPAITAVGGMYERREYFLPQLLLSAEAMQAGFERLRPLLERDGRPRGRVVVMATVEGDIHDIGKNIVCLMLRNHGFRILDLGKDVSARVIVDTAEREGAAIIGLSALMTSTMVRMEETVALIRERGLKCRVMIGGAVVTEAYARRIGADGYARDAVEAVRVAKRLSES
ncbi:MAG: methionine synthase [Deltaproteobacteria bacterium]|nr:methionine synthase [Deltaproteobacteria bacterium]